MKLKILYRILSECSFNVIRKLLVNLCFRSITNLNNFKSRIKNNKSFFPAFIAISITNKCNLSCIGCWVTNQKENKELSSSQLDNIINISKKKGSYFFGILGGEPLLYKSLFNIIQKHKDCYFQIFTNGTLLSKSTALKMKLLGNISPLISIEGFSIESKNRRGQTRVFENSIKAIENCTEQGLFTGVSSSICKSNYDELVSKQFIDFLIQKKVQYLWYYIYRPVGSNPAPELALSNEQILNLRKFIVESRKTENIIIIDAYWDDKGNAVCPAATGISHHIGPGGAVEFCPPLQFAVDFLNEDASNLDEIFNTSSFLDSFRKFTAKTTRGCIILEEPNLLLNFLKNHNAIDTSSRNVDLQELSKMKSLPGHSLKGNEIKEKSLFYRLAKKKYFFGFGAYG